MLRADARAMTAGVAGSGVRPRPIMKEATKWQLVP